MKKKIVFIVASAQSDDPIPECSINKKIHKRAFKMVFEVLKKFPGYKLIIKGRREWDMQELPTMIGKNVGYKDFEIIINIDSIRLFSDAEFVIDEGYSTMVLDALIMNKPIINLGWEGYEKFFNYNNTKGVIVVYNKKQFEKAVTKIINKTSCEDI